MSGLIAPRTDYQVLEECEQWMVVGKPAPLIVHPTNDRPELNLMGELQKNSPGSSFFFVNRLDRETSGCVLVAKTREAAGYFGKLMMERQIRKTYHALVRGWPEWEEKLLEAPILRMGEVEESSVWVRQMVHSEGKPCTTKFVLEEKFERKEGRFAVIRCEPITGRTHQLRVHLEYLGHAIVGDKIYGGNPENYLEFIETAWTDALQQRLLLDRHALHSSEMTFDWEGEEVRIQCPWPAELDDFRIGG